jgi:hypothetical protein
MEFMTKRLRRERAGVGCEFKTFGHGEKFKIVGKPPGKLLARRFEPGLRSR